MTSTYQPQPITPAGLKELRVCDDAGCPMRPYVDEEGGAPLRCCLRLSAVGDRIALVSYAPLRRWAAETGAGPGAYDEQGPVFIHAEDCGGPDPDGTGYPWARPGALRVFRRYDSRGHIMGGRMVELSEDASAAFAVPSLRPSPTRIPPRFTCGLSNTAVTTSAWTGPDGPRGRTPATTGGRPSPPDRRRPAFALALSCQNVRLL